MSLFKRKSSSGAKINIPASASISSDDFSGVTHIDDCLHILNIKNIVNHEGLQEGEIAALHACCRAMRQRGWCLEPNLLSRAAMQCISNLRRTGEETLRFACEDTDFCRLTAEAAAELSRQDFVRSEYLYFQALLLYPAHPNATVQYAHALKDQGKFSDALVHYLDAEVWGAPKKDIQEHALFVANNLGLRDEVVKRIKDETPKLPSSYIRTLYEFLCGQRLPKRDILPFMIAHADPWSLMESVIRSDGFKHANRDLLRMLADMNWTPDHA